MAIGIAYIGQRRFEKTSKPNHKKLFNRLSEKYQFKIYDFIKDSPNPECPFTSSGGIQVWDFLKAKDSITEDIIIKLRSDIWFTRSSMNVLIKYLDKVVSEEFDIVFLGLDFLNACDKLCQEYPVHGAKKITDFVIISRKSAIVENEKVIFQISGPKHKSGNQMFRAIVKPESKAVSVSCQMYLLRKDYENPNTWQLYKEWTDEYYKSQESQEWVLNNKEIIGTF